MRLQINIMIMVFLIFWVPMSLCGCLTGLKIEGNKRVIFVKCNERHESVPVKVSIERPENVDEGLVIKGSAPSYIVLRWRRKGSNEEWNAKAVQKQNDLYPMTIPISEVPQEYEYKIEADAVIAEIHGKGAGLSEPYTIDVNCQEGSTVIVEGRPAYKDGYESARRFLNEELQVYRLVIKLHSLSSSDRDQFLQGFKGAYAEANHRAVGEKYENILQQSVEGGTYEQALVWGRRHVTGQASNSLVRGMIRNSVSLSRSLKLGWQAGYIEGFVQEMAERIPTGQDNETLYGQAKDMYDSLSWIVE